MNYSKEYIDKSQEFLKLCESDTLLMTVLEKGNLTPLSHEDEKALNDWLEGGDPAVFEFMMKFVKSDFIQNELKLY